MPRDGSGHGDNAMELGKEFEHNITHGAGTEKPDHVARADKTAPLPEPEKGAALEGMNAAGGSNSGSDSTKP